MKESKRKRMTKERCALGGLWHTTLFRVFECGRRRVRKKRKRKKLKLAMGC